jgi:hypothetical protein
MHFTGAAQVAAGMNNSLFGAARPNHRPRRGDKKRKIDVIPPDLTVDPQLVDGQATLDQHVAVAIAEP